MRQQDLSTDLWCKTGIRLHKRAQNAQDTGSGCAGGNKGAPLSWPSSGTRRTRCNRALGPPHCARNTDAENEQSPQKPVTVWNTVGTTTKKTPQLMATRLHTASELASHSKQGLSLQKAQTSQQVHCTLRLNWWLLHRVDLCRRPCTPQNRHPRQCPEEQRGRDVPCDEAGSLWPSSPLSGCIRQKK